MTKAEPCGAREPEATECQTPDYTDGPCHCAFHDPAELHTEPTSAPRGFGTSLAARELRRPYQAKNADTKESA